VDEDAIVQIVGCGMPLPGAIVDLSREGCRVRTRERVFARAPCPVEIAFKANGAAFRFHGIVEWTDNRNLLGIRFVNVAPERIAELVETLGGMVAAAEKDAEAANELAARQKAEAQAKREARKSAESGNREPGGVKTAESQAKQPDATPVPAAAGQQTSVGGKQRDRRDRGRQEVDTSAKIFLVKVASHLQGHILDLSPGGCRIRTDERFPVGIYTRVEAEFRLEGLPFRLGGVIQNIYDRNTVGIRFLDLSERKEQQVLDLIAEIQQIRAPQCT
jgi:hypothetical protein